MKNGVIGYLVSAIRNGTDFIEHFAKDKYGWKLWEENGEYTLEIDNIIVRDKLVHSEQIKEDPIVFSEEIIDKEPIEEPVKELIHNKILWDKSKSKRTTTIDSNGLYCCDIEETSVNTGTTNILNIRKAENGDKLELYGIIEPFCSLYIEPYDEIINNNSKIIISSNSSKKTYCLSLMFIDKWIITNWLDLGCQPSISIK